VGLINVIDQCLINVSNFIMDLINVKRYRVDLSDVISLRVNFIIVIKYYGVDLMTEPFLEWT
jgi:hypothetical protein